MISIEGCTDRLRKWLDNNTKKPSQRGSWTTTNRNSLITIADHSPYYFDCHNDQDKYESSSATAVLYWAMLRHSKTMNLKSTTLLQFFRFVEIAPLLCMVDDFLDNLDSFFMESEKNGDETGHSCILNEAWYLRGLELKCLLKCRLFTMSHQWRTVLDQSIRLKWEDFVNVHQRLLIEQMNKLIDQTNALLLRYFSSDISKPRFIRMCNMLKLTEKETDAMTYIFIQNCGVLFSKLYSRFSTISNSSAANICGNHSNSMALGAAIFSGMTGEEMYEFFSESRSHLKQELFGPEDEFSSILSSSFLLMSPTVAKACCGGILSPEETYKIDKTVLAEILASEKLEIGQKKKPDTKNDKLLEDKQTTTPTDDNEKKGVETDEEETGSDKETGSVKEEEELELEDILRVCGDIQSTLDQSKEGDSEDSQVYKNDLEYLEDNFELIETLVKARKTETSDDILMLRSDQRRPEAVIREMKAKARSLKAKIEQKMEATKKGSDWLPRLERLAELRRLNNFEKNSLLTLTGCMVSRNLRDSGGNDSVFRHHINIGMLIGLFCEGLEEQIKARVYFYQNSILVKEGLVHVSDPPLLSRGNFLDNGVELDRRLLDYIVGLDTEINELVDGSDLYTPDTELSDVALPVSQRDLIMNAFESFHKFRKTCKDLKINTRGSSKGLCMLFYGPSGTGKTMTANAVAKYLNKKILLVTVSLLNEAQLSKDLLRFIFREAKIHNAIIFFDECEPIFESRDNRPNLSLALMLTEIEQYDDIIILATNRHHDLDEAMHRRIQLALPFSVPDYTLRKEIWKSHVPDQLIDQQANVIDWDSLAMSFELTGGLIRNAVLSSIALASKTTPTDNNIRLTYDNLYNGAKLQLRGLLEMVDFERRVIPTFGLEEIILEQSTKNIINAIINTGKTHKFITTQWGFSDANSDENVAQAGGVVCLMCGSAGVGKTTVAHSIAYELGQPIKEANCSELLSHSVTSNPRVSKGIGTFFRDAQRANAIVVLDGAEFIFGSVAGNLVSGIIGCETYSLAYQIERYPGMVILTSRQETGLLDISRVPHLRYVVSLRCPSISLREKIWKKLLPKKVPKGITGIEYSLLAERYSINGGQIASIICSAAEKAVSNDDPIVTTDLLCESTEEYLLLQETGRNHQFSLFQ